MFDLYEEARKLECQKITARQIKNELKNREIEKEDLMEFGSHGYEGNQETNALFQYSTGQLRKLREIMQEREYYFHANHL